MSSAAWADENGDVAFSVLALAAASDMDLQAALERALEKYAARLTDRGQAGSEVR